MYPRTTLFEEKHILIMSDCGSSLYSQPVALAGVTQIKSGNLQRNVLPIMAEIFVSRRQDFVTAIEGTKQAPGMP